MSDDRELLLGRTHLIKSALAALAVASALTVLVVLPAELGWDPTGFGRLSGLLRTSPRHAEPLELTEQASSNAKVYGGPFRSDVIEIPIGLGAELEYKVAMRAGEALVYSWNVVGEGKVYFEFHGESQPPEPRVESYLTGDGAHEANGALIAPFAGIHGWYLLNDSETPIVVRLRLSGYYELAPQFAEIGSARKP